MLRTACTMIWILCMALFANAAEHTTDTLETVQENTAEKTAVLVDVRESNEWATAHVKGAFFLPLAQLKEADQAAVLKKLPKDKVVYTYCRAGVRSLKAAEHLEKWGYEVRPLKAGYEELVKFGFEAEKGEP